MEKEEIKTVYFGTPQFALAPLTALIKNEQVKVLAVVTNPDKPAKRGKKITPPPVKMLALNHNIPVLQYRSVRKENDAVLNALKYFGEIDVGIVCAFGQIIPKSLLKLPKKGMINIHPSLLPRWRGAAPIERAILAGDKETGVTLMRLTEGLDEGPIYTSASLPITPDDTGGSLREKLSALGAQLLVENLPLIVEGKLLPHPQPKEGITYADKVLKEEALLDFTKESAVQIERKVRAFNPTPGAFTYLNGKRLKIYRVKTALNGETALNYPPATVVVAEKGRFEITCKEGSVLLQKVQIEGGKAVGVKEFLNGRTVKSGTRIVC